jgi:eukaryotic-like serine/threonine-protein kinase
MAKPLRQPEPFGPFLLLETLGVGGMGHVYLARHEERDELLVVKRLRPELAHDEVIFRRFVHEAEVASHVDHPNVARLIAFGTVDGEPFLATEFVAGISAMRIVDNIESGILKPMPLQVALHLSVDLLRGIEAIHAARHRDTDEHLRLIHRDINNRNAIVGFDGRLRIIDFGLGKSTLSNWQTAQQLIAGSPDYMAPEQVLGETADQRSDVYAAAVTVYELLAGRKRFREPNLAASLNRAVTANPELLRDARPDASRLLESLLQRAMAPEIHLRMRKISILRKSFERELKRVARRTGNAENVHDWLRSRFGAEIQARSSELGTMIAIKARPDHRSDTRFLVRAVRDHDKSTVVVRGAPSTRPKKSRLTPALGLFIVPFLLGVLLFVLMRLVF